MKFQDLLNRITEEKLKELEKQLAFEEDLKRWDEELKQIGG